MEYLAGPRHVDRLGRAIKGPARLAFVCLLALGSACKQRDTDHGTEVKAAREAARSEGDRWLKNGELEAALVRPGQACHTKAPDGERSRFTMYLNLLRAGAVTRVLVDPELPFARCFGDEMKTARFSGVPKDGTWLEVAMAMDTVVKE